MSVLVIELNDAGVTAVHESRPAVEVVPPSPGFALLTGDKVLTGVAAFRRYRLEPRYTASHFWETLDTTPLPRPFPRQLTHADLVHAHLEAIWRGVQSGVDDVILAVPGWYTDEQLGLILGITRSCGMPVHGMIDSAVAASSTVESAGKRVYMDIHLHRTAATTLSSMATEKLRDSLGLDGSHRGRPDRAAAGPPSPRLRRTRRSPGANTPQRRRGELSAPERPLEDDAAEIQRGSVEVHPRLGLISFWDAWVKLVAKTFIHETRFDPLHLAETEQGLYLSLPQWLDRLREQEATRLVMEAGGKDYSIELHRDDVIECVRPQYEEISRLVGSLEGLDENVTLLLSYRLSRLPGLVDLLSAREGVDVIVLAPVAAATGALQVRDRILASPGKEELTFVTRLSLDVQEGEAPSISDPSKATRTTPTHILLDGIARPIAAEPFFIEGTTCRIQRREDSVIVDDQGDSDIFVNDRKMDGQLTLQPGDRVRVGSSGVEVQLIHVKD